MSLTSQTKCPILCRGSVLLSISLLRHGDDNADGSRYIPEIYSKHKKYKMKQTKPSKSDKISKSTKKYVTIEDYVHKRYSAGKFGKSLLQDDVKRIFLVFKAYLQKHPSFKTILSQTELPESLITKASSVDKLQAYFSQSLAATVAVGKDLYDHISELFSIDFKIDSNSFVVVYPRPTRPDTVSPIRSRRSSWSTMSESRPSPATTEKTFDSNNSPHSSVHSQKDSSPLQSSESKVPPVLPTLPPAATAVTTDKPLSSDSEEESPVVKKRLAALRSAQAYKSKYRLDADGKFYPSPKDVLNNLFILPSGDTFNMIVERELGVGTFGVVVQVIITATSNPLHGGFIGKRMALKILPNTGDSEFNNNEEISASLYISQKDPHGTYNIIRSHEILKVPGLGNTCILMDLGGVSLITFQKSMHGQITMRDIAHIAFDVTIALDFLHWSLKIVHGDMKPENILIRGVLRDDHLRVDDVTGMSILPVHYSACICDMGNVYEQGRTDGALANTMQYRPPENVNKKSWFCSSDIWAMGCILYEMVTGKFLFNLHSNMTAYQCNLIYKEILGPVPQKFVDLPISESTRDETSEILRSSMPKADPLLIDLIRQCLHYDRSKRIQTHQLLVHPFIQKYYPESLENGYVQFLLGPGARGDKLMY